MIKLEDKTNVNAPSAGYPYGSLRNNPGDNTGTPVNVALVSDVMQTVEKLMAESGIVANGLPDNDTNGWQIYDALMRVVNPYKEFVGILRAGGTGGGISNVFNNTLPYISSSTPLSPTNRTVIVLGDGSFTGKPLSDFDVNVSLNMFTSSGVIAMAIHNVTYAIVGGNLSISVDFYNANTGEGINLLSVNNQATLKLNVRCK